MILKRLSGKKIKMTGKEQILLFLLFNHLLNTTNIKDYLKQIVLI